MNCSANTIRSNGGIRMSETFAEMMDKIKKDVHEILESPLSGWGKELNRLTYTFCTYERIVEEKKQLLTANNKAKLIKELKALQEVAEATDSEGKKLYSNDKSREFAKNKKLEDDTGYNTVCKSIQELEMEIKETEIIAKYLYYSRQNIMAVIKARCEE